MLYYKNASRSTKTFYGVTFEPGSIHGVPGVINHIRFVRISPVVEEPPKRSGRKKTVVEDPQEEILVEEEKVYGPDCD